MEKKGLMYKWQIHLITGVTTGYIFTQICTDDTSGKYATGVNDARGILQPVPNDTGGRLWWQY